MLAGSGLIAARPAQAQQNITINNFSFESPTVPTDPGYTVSDISGWTSSGTVSGDFGVQSLVVDPQLYPSGIPDGLQYSYVNEGGIYQDILTPITAGTTYTLTAFLGERTDFQAPGSISLYTSDGILLAGTGSVSSPAGTFTPYTVTFTEGASNPDLGKTLRIVLAKEGLTGQVNFDDVTLTASAAPVPEASTTVSFGLLLALGLGGMAVASRKKRVTEQVG